MFQQESCALETISDGFQIFDANDELVFDNSEESNDNIRGDNDDWDGEGSEPLLDIATPDEARRFLTMFFDGREMYCGGPIPINELLETKNIEMVLRLELVDCIDIFYSCLSEVRFGLDKDQWDRLDELRNKNSLSEDDRHVLHQLGDKLRKSQTELFFDLQKQSFDLSIPRHHSGGILLVWLRLCMGFDL